MSSQRTTVALVAHAVHDHGGMERSFFELVRSLHGEIHFVVVSAELADELQPLVEWRRIRVPMRPIPLKTVLFSLLAARQIAKVNADLVHTMGAIVPNKVDVATVQFCSAGFREATGRLAPAESPPLRRLNTAIVRRLALLLERWCYRPPRLRRLAAVSSHVASELERHYPGISVALTPNGVDTERFQPNARARVEVRAELGAGDAIAALFVGGDWDRKGLGVAIDGAARARRAGAEVELWVVGRGDEERFGELAAKAGIGIRFLGTQARTERFYQAADLFVLPSLYETFSLAAHEAAACALPVVATAVGGIDELLAGGGPGVLVERDPEAVGAALALLALDPALRAGMGAAGRNRAGRLDWASSVGSVRAEYGQLLAGGAA